MSSVRHSTCTSSPSPISGKALDRTVSQHLRECSLHDLRVLRAERVPMDLKPAPPLLPLRIAGHLLVGIVLQELIGGLFECVQALARLPALDGSRPLTLLPGPLLFDQWPEQCERPFVEGRHKGVIRNQARLARGVQDGNRVVLRVSLTPGLTLVVLVPEIVDRFAGEPAHGTTARWRPIPDSGRRASPRESRVST